mgnify:FL=1
MSLKETYVSNLKNVPEKNRIFVMMHRGHDCLAPSPAMVEAIKKEDEKLQKKGMDPVEAHNAAFEKTKFEEQYRKKIANDQEAQERMQEIKELAKKEDVYLICYEKEPKKCHRHILIDLINKL